MRSRILPLPCAETHPSAQPLKCARLYLFTDRVDDESDRLLRSVRDSGAAPLADLPRLEVAPLSSREG